MKSANDEYVDDVLSTRVLFRWSIYSCETSVVGSRPLSVSELLTYLCLCVTQFLMRAYQFCCQSPYRQVLYERSLMSETVYICRGEAQLV